MSNPKGGDAYWKATLGLLTKIMIVWFWFLTAPAFCLLSN